ncbi:MFS transporter [Acinetobacter sichuanensis]|uniref:MFS transporter n=1 Tax=Acinetobacter sichuanensis TaxID=2136183 RepID=A0A371YLJ7_9GAMM|nr:aromatic acid/H+ symport family MFS transporter [Acinetobacter sichuanensis]RFC82204.1 MFS transporter [Acinetobacter sichuanensis]
MQNHQNTMDVQRFIDENPLSNIQKRIIWLCFIVVAIDGFDTASIGFIAPALKSAWSLQAIDLAPLFGAGLLGLMLGAIIFGPLGDRFGRKTILVCSIFVFGHASMFSAFSSDLNTLIIWRFVTGLGLGAAMPNAISLTSEYSPTPRRSNLVTLMFCGFTLGSAIGGLSAAYLLSFIGWKGILMLGGILPLMVMPLIYFLLPESLRFLVLKNKSKEKIDKILRQILPNSLNIPHLIPTQEEKINSGLRDLFGKKYILGTILIWTSFFLSLLIIYLISSWMPTILNNHGYNIKAASWLTSVFQIGGTVGAIVIGYFMDKIGSTKMLSIAYLFGAFFLVILGLSIQNLYLPLLLLAMFGVGMGISGAQVGMNAFSSSYYPTQCRATGVSWANAVGRSGSIIGSVIGGWLMALNLSSFVIISLLAIPAIIAAFCIYMLNKMKEKIKHEKYTIA